MTREQCIEQDLTGRFPFLEGAVRIQRPRRMFVDVPREHFGAVFEYLARESGFTILCAITGLDQGGMLAALYHLAQETGIVLTVTVAVPKEAPVLPTVTGYFPAADAYEREMVDLLGMDVVGLPPGPRYPLPDDWPAGEYPLRKDWRSPEEAPLPEAEKELPDAD